MTINTLGNHPSRHKSHWETFAQHNERMRIFRISHELVEYTKCLKASGYTLARTQQAPASPKNRPSLPKIGYVLNVTHKCGTVLLPRNWQN
jgi:hypothetical protein